ncbi:chemotaxis protein CheB [Oxalobacteraceae bacterium R-40]|uniref:protein-glutamate methylesterase n=1 Tax=Keguizhuia sedimenti TaxID=3064264 RepID=A0ABU1BMV2_9BURK|nr:chemotaxis protein CheB [Oxalobacteraceae bacterium R-40]
MAGQDKHIELVVIGASAGGVEALSVLLQALPEDFYPPVAIVLHLPPDRSTALPQLLARKCARPVKEAEDKEPLVNGTVYFAPPDYHLLVEPDRSLSLSRDEPLHYSRPSIDMLFESAAMACRETVLGIILTGASKDGAEGLKQIRTCGGLAWIQQPDEALSRIMPEAAISTAGADQVLTLKQLSENLSRLTAPAIEAD